MSNKVEILKEELVFNGFFKIKQGTIKQNEETFKRLSFERGEAVAAVIYNKAKDSLIFVNQYRYPVGDFIMELCAGSVDNNEAPLKTIVREIEEEIGYKVEYKPKLINSFYSSPGGSSEMIHLYYIEIESSEKISKNGGLANENEYIEVCELDVKSVHYLLNTGRITDAKTIIGLNYFFYNVKN